MALKENQVARLVRVKLNSNFEINSLSDQYLACEHIIYISDSHIYNDSKGKYVHIKGGSNVNSGFAYLNELDLEFPITDSPLYLHSEIDYNQDLSKFKNNLI
jgi:hypothetical protein